MLQSRKSLGCTSTIPIKEDFTTEASLYSKSPNRKILSRHSTSFTPKTGMGSPNGAMTPIGWSSSIQEKGPGGHSPLSKFGNELGKRRRKPVKNEREPIRLGRIEEAVSVVQTPKRSMQCDYASLIMCFPESMQSLTDISPSKPFVTFSELTKTVKNKHEGKRLEDILKDNIAAKTAPSDGVNAMDKRELMKKVLEYNKIQKHHYLKEMLNEKRNVLLPLIKQVKTKSKSYHVKVLPSRKLYEDTGSVEIVIHDKHSPSNSPEASPPTATKQSMVSSQSMSSLTGSKKATRERRAALFKVSEESGFAEQPIFQPPVKSYKAYWITSGLNAALWRPDVREGHTFTTVGKQIVLYGGLSTTLSEEVAVYEPIRNIWEKIQATGDVPLMGRHGHTACEYKKGLIIFGGEHQFNSALNVRECLDDTRMFTLEKKEWKIIRTAGQILPRRDHAATVHSNAMIVYGGINSEGHYMKDVWALNLKVFAWEKVEVTGDKEFGLAFHSMCACYADKAGMSLTKDNRSKVAEEGVYVFGGKSPEGKILNKLKIFNYESKTPFWSYPVTKGVPPTARYNHTTLYYEPLGLLIVYGGKNDHLYESANDVCLNDIRMLNLENMSWSQATSYGDAPKVGRYRHAVAGFGSRMLIFGGVEFHKYADDEVKGIELNQARIKRMVMDLEESSHERSKSTSDSHGAILRDKRRMSPELTSSPTKSPLQFLSFLPVPGPRPQYDEVFEEDQVLKPAHELSQHERNILSRLG